MRVVGLLFMALTFLAGITIGTLEVAMINVVVFLGLSLMVLWLFGKRLGSQGTAFSLFGTFLMSFTWPMAVILLIGDFDPNCEPTGKPDASCSIQLVSTVERAKP